MGAGLARLALEPPGAGDEEGVGLAGREVPVPAELSEPPEPPELAELSAGGVAVGAPEAEDAMVRARYDAAAAAAAARRLLHALPVPSPAPSARATALIDFCVICLDPAGPRAAPPRAASQALASAAGPPRPPPPGASPGGRAAGARARLLPCGVACG